MLVHEGLATLAEFEAVQEAIGAFVDDPASIATLVHQISFGMKPEESRNAVDEELPVRSR